MFAFSNFNNNSFSSQLFGFIQLFLDVVYCSCYGCKPVFKCLHHINSYFLCEIFFFFKNTLPNMMPLSFNPAQPVTGFEISVQLTDIIVNSQISLHRIMHSIRKVCTIYIYIFKTVSPKLIES